MNRIIFFFFCIIISGLYAEESPKLLVQIHTKARPEQFLNVLDKYYQKLSNQIPYHFLITCDYEDPAMNSPEMRERLAVYPNLSVLFGRTKSHAEARNLGIESLNFKFDVILVASDQLEPVENHYDKLIVEAMQKEFPDYDGVINFSKEGTESINIAPVLGKKFYKRFGYIYNPEYQFSFYDSELTFVSRMLAKEAVINQDILKASVKQTAKFMNPRDRQLFHKRRLDNFDLHEDLLKSIFVKDWSILICTLQERVEPFSHIYNKLQKQIKDHQLEDRVEILYFKDNRENTVGFKRNALLRQSRGQYVNFIDDDDDVHDEYIRIIYEKLKARPDCVSLEGIITFNGNNATTFIHSIKYDSYFQKDGIYYRPPNHLNTIKRVVASQFLFPEISFGEDTNWAMRISKAGLLKKEEKVTVPYYFYKYVDK